MYKSRILIMFRGSNNLFIIGWNMINNNPRIHSVNQKENENKEIIFFLYSI